MTETETVEIALSLGGNLGNVPETFSRALSLLADGGLTSVKMSSLYRTAPVGCKPGTPDFMNAAVAGKWKGSLEELHALCRNTEVSCGRPAGHARFDSRTLDIDIVFFGDLVQSGPELTIPHIEASRRLFVLIPLAEILGDTAFPGLGMTVDKLLDNSRDSLEFRAIASTRRSLLS